MASTLLLLSFTLNSLVFQASFAVMGSIRNTDGQRMDSIRVSLLDENYQTLKTVFTDTTGRYVFRGVRSGSYVVRVMPVGTPYEEASQRVELRSLSVGSGRRPGAEEPFIVDLIIRRKAVRAAPEVKGTVFAQTVPEQAQAEYKRGASRLKDNKSEEGVASLRKALEIFPDYYLALELLGTEYVKRGDFNAALPVLTRALELNRQAPKTLYALGVAYLKLNRYDDSIEALEKAGQLDPSNANVPMMLGLAHGYKGALGEAEASFKKAYQLGGDQAAEAHFYLAGIYNKQERYADAVRELELYLKNADGVDEGKVREMIAKLKTKQKARSN